MQAESDAGPGDHRGDQYVGQGGARHGGRPLVGVNRLFYTALEIVHWRRRRRETVHRELHRSASMRSLRLRRAMRRWRMSGEIRMRHARPQEEGLSHELADNDFGKTDAMGQRG